MLTEIGLIAAVIILISVAYRTLAAVQRIWRLRSARKTLRGRSQDDPELNAAVEQIERVAPKISVSGLAMGALEAAAAGAILFSNLTPTSSPPPTSPLPPITIAPSPSPPPPDIIVPSRMFAGPHQYPPRQFKAYGILAFVTRPTEDNKDRFNMICDAYRETLPHYREVPAPPSDQMVTVWPIDGDSEADDINRIARDKVCARAVPRYGIVTAQEAIEAAKRNSAVLSGRGPFLLAWAPGSDKGKPDALVLVSNLSNVAISADAELLFVRWREEIQEDKSLWNNGWDPDRLKVKVRIWADRYGQDILTYFKKS